MSYQVLARKWRPHNFTEVVGQGHVVKSLVNALQHDRLHHAYLFTGTRGVGKTTIARILAKALNCENRTGFDPCGQCAVCRDLDEGRFLDLIEVDAASRTKVEDTRDLLDNAQYAPNRGKYKIYLIDEVHMLSGHSFNALLKTLEEPPPHVKFLLATTDPQKIPVTVLSRCLQFNLKRLLPEQISTQMASILDQEQIEYDMPALRQLARAADGSMRDGLSLLDQAIVFGNGRVTAAEVRNMLGTVARQPVDNLLRALANADPARLLQEIARISDLTADFADVLRQMLRILHHLAIGKAVLGVLHADEDMSLLEELGPLFSAEDIQLYYQIGLLGQRDLELAPDPRSGFEMVMLRMLAFRPASTAADLKPPQAMSETAAGKDVAMPRTVQDAPEAPRGNREVAPPAAAGAVAVDWAAMIETMQLGAMTRELANNCVLRKIDDKTCQLLLDAEHQQLQSNKTRGNLQQALRKYTGKPLKLSIQIEKSLGETPARRIDQDREDRQRAAVEAITNDENIQALQDNFDARVIPGTIEPLDTQAGEQK